MLFGKETVGRVGSSMNPCPPIEGSTYSTWARTEMADKNTTTTTSGKRDLLIIIILCFLGWASGLKKEFLRATFFRPDQSATGNGRLACLHSRKPGYRSAGCWKI